MDYKIEDIIQTKKDTTYKRTSAIWNKYHLNSTKNVGNCAYAAKVYMKTHQNPTLDEWERFYYLTEKTPENLQKNAEKFQEKLAENKIIISIDTAQKYQWIRVIFDTFVGIIQKESIALKAIKKLNQKIKIRHTDDEEDRKYCLDLIAYNGVKYAGYQIKPISFLYGIQKQDIQNDLKNCLKKQEEWLQKTGNTMVVWYFYAENPTLKFYAVNYEEMKGKLRHDNTSRHT